MWRTALPISPCRPVGMWRSLRTLVGLASLCADACEAAGLSVPELTLHAVGALEGLLPPEASAGNPVDMIASATAEQYGEALRILLGDPSVHALIAIFIPPLVTRAEDVAAELMKVAAEKKRATVVGVLSGRAWDS